MFRDRITPRFGDIDGLRHINNCLIPQWFELGRSGIFRFFHPDLALDSWSLIMAGIRVDFTAQMRLGKDVEIRTWVKKVGRSSLTVYQEAWQDGVMGAWGEAVVVHYDFEAEASVPIPDAVREKLSEHLLPEGASASTRCKANG